MNFENMSDQDFTVFIGNLSEKVTEEMLYELFLQAGPLQSVRIPSVKGVRKMFGFAVFKHQISVPYALQLLDDTPLFDRHIKLNSRSKFLDQYRPTPPRMPAKERLGAPVPDHSSSLRMMGGGVNNRKYSDKSMLPARKAPRMREESPPGNWDPIYPQTNYPSQNKEAKEKYISNGSPKSRNRYNHGSSRRSHYEKGPYYNEKYHTRDKNRFEPQSSRQRHHRFIH